MFSHGLLIALLFLCGFSKEMPGNQPEVLINTNPVSCNGGSDGKISILVADNSQAYVAQIFKYSPSGTYLEAQIINDTTHFNLDDLTSGKYFIEIKGDKGFSFTQSIEVNQPDKLETGIIAVRKKLSAPDASDAILKAVPEGGVPPYTFSWNVEGKNKNSPELKNVRQGTYTCIINDANHCGPVKASILFNQYVIPDIVEE